MQTTVIIIMACAALFLGYRLYLSLQIIRKHKERFRLIHQERRLVFDFLHDIGEAFTEEIDKHQLLDIILRCSTQVTSASSGIIYLVDPSKKKIAAESISGLFPPPVQLPEELENKVASRAEYLETLLRNEPIDLSDAKENIYAHVCTTGNSEWVADASEDRRFPKTREKSLQLNSLIAVPLKYRNEVLGVLALANHANDTNFTLSDFEVAKSIASQASFSLHNATLYSQLAEKQRLDRDLETAREIQRILLPQTCPVIPGYRLAATNKPAQSVSGDYYDFLPIDEDHLGIVIADVSGKGVPASLIMAMCRTVMRTEAVGLHSAAEVLRKANTILYPDIREDMFITMAYMILDFRKHTLTIAKAGHDAPLICTDHFKKIEALQAPGMALGIDSGEVFDNVLQDLVVPMELRDTVLIYTDGINEATDPDGREFGRDQVKSTLKSAAPDGVDYLVQNMVERVTRFTGDAAQFDDMTLVAIQRQ